MRAARAPDIAMLVHRLDRRAICQLVLEISRELVALGERVLLIAAAEDPEARADVPAGVEVAVLGLAYDRTAFAIPGLAALLRARRPAVLFAHHSGPARAAIAAREVAGPPPRIVTVDHNHYSSYVSPTGGGWRNRRLRGRMTGLLYPRADVVAGVAPELVADLVERFGGSAWRTAVLPDPGRDPATLARLAAEPVHHPWYAPGPDRPRIVCSVANLIPRKGQRTLVEALPALRARAGDVRLVLVGREDSAAYAAEIDRVARELGVAPFVDRVGYQANPVAFMARADVFALASVNEGCPRVLSEAMTCGVPVVSTDCPSGPAFILENGAAGLLVPTGDAAAMADALARALEDAALRARLVERGRERARAFTPRRVAEAYRELARALDPRAAGAPAPVA